MMHGCDDDDDVNDVNGDDVSDDEDGVFEKGAKRALRHLLRLRLLEVNLRSFRLL